MNVKIIVLLAAIVTGLIVASSALYIVNETEQVIITRFGQPASDAVTDAGLHVKVPFIDVVNRFDKRFLEWDGAQNDIPTLGKVFIYVDAYARWRINDPLKFLQTLQGSELSAQSRLDDILDGETRNAVARHTLVEVVRTSNRVPAVVEGDEDDVSVLEEIQTGRPDVTLQIKNAAAPALLELLSARRRLQHCEADLAAGAELCIVSRSILVCDGRYPVEQNIAFGEPCERRPIQHRRRRQLHP